MTLVATNGESWQALGAGREDGVGLAPEAVTPTRSSRSPLPAIPGDSRQPNQPDGAFPAEVAAPTDPPRPVPAAGRLMAEWCRQNAVSQAELSRRLGFSGSWVNAVANGWHAVPDFARLRRVAEVTGIPFEQLTADLRLPPEQRVRTGMRLDQVLVAVESGGNRPGDELSPDRRQQIVSHLRRIAGWLDRPPADIPADPRQLEALMQGWNAASFGVTKELMQKIKSSVRVALEIAGARPTGARPIHMVDVAWRRLYDAAAACEQKRGAEGHFRLRQISAFIRYCDARGVAPGSVTAATFDSYAAERGRYDLGSANLTRSLRLARLAWNAFAGEIPGWPAPIPEAPKEPGLRLPLDSFPESFRMELEAYKQAGGVRDAGRYDPKQVGYIEAGRNRRDAREKSRDMLGAQAGTSGIRPIYDPLAPDTVARHADTIRLAASSLIRRGLCRPDRINSIADAANVDAAVEMVLDYQSRHGDKSTSTRRTLVMQLLAVAARWRTDVSDDELAQFRDLLGTLPRSPDEMSEVDAEIVNPILTDPEQVTRIIELPLRVIAAVEAERKRNGTVTEAMALRAETAIILILILSMAPRRGTIARTRIAHITWPRRKGANGSVYWPPLVVKNRKALRAELSPWKLRLLRLHLKHYRPTLGDQSNPYLFPGRRLGNRDGFRSPQCVAENLQKLIWTELGLKIRTHLWRKIMAGFLMNETEDERAVRELLGQSPNSPSTHRYVQQLKSLWASRRVDRALTDLVGEFPVLIVEELDEAAPEDGFKHAATLSSGPRSSRRMFRRRRSPAEPK